MYTGQIGLVPHPQTPAEHLIDWVTRSPVHHSVVAISETECVSCEPGGALLRPLSRFPDAIWSHFDHTPAETAGIVGWARAHVGAPYGWLQFFAIGVALLTKTHTPDWLRRYLNSGKSFECAQYCDAAYTAAGIYLFKDAVPSDVYPGMFVPIWGAHGWM